MRQVVAKLSQYGKVFITAERQLPRELEELRLPVPPHRIHDVLASASLYLGEGATMATEAGLLGTPSVYVSPLVGSMGNFEELRDQYGLVYSYSHPADALYEAIQILDQDDVKEEWTRRRERLLAKKTDVTKFICDLLETCVSDTIAR
jgi:predicted glycosyltransferase